MRTKTALLTAALVAAGAASSMAQVYSLNVVGYINVALTNGFQMIACPLICNPDNTVTTLFGNPPALPPASILYKFVNATGQYQSDAVSTKGTHSWTDGNVTLAPGEGAFLLYNGGAGTSTNVTFVGTVPQASGGPLSIAINPGFQIVSPHVPVAGGLQTALNYQPSKGDTVFQYNPVTGQYVSSSSSIKTGLWSPSEPQIPVGSSFFLSTTNTGTWTNNFTVQ